MELSTLSRLERLQQGSGRFKGLLLRHFAGSVRVRTSIAATVVVGAAVAVASLGLVHVLSSQLTQNLVVTARSEAASIATLIRSGEIANPIPLPRGDLGAQVVDSKGAIIASTENVAGRRPLIGMNDLEATMPNTPFRVSVPDLGAGGDGDTRGIIVALPVTSGEGLATNLDPAFSSLVSAQSKAGIIQLSSLPSGATSKSPYYVLVLASLQGVDEPIRALGVSLLVGIPLLLVIVALATFYLTGRAFKPVEQIMSDADEIGGTSLHNRVFVPEGKDEIASLARTMNRMLSRLEESAESSRRFVADASHELKSPISALQTALEVSLLRPDQTDWKSVALDGLAESQRMQTIVEDLLILAKDDAGQLKVGRNPVDLDDIVIEEATRARSTTGSRIELAEVSGGRVLGEPEKLRSVVRNLMENAVRHCESQVSIVLTQRDFSVRLEVLDDGRGVPEADRALIFDRFVRLDQSRSRSGGGTGLGLAITKSIVEAHGGRIWVEENQRVGHGARFVVELPAEDPTVVTAHLESIS